MRRFAYYAALMTLNAMLATPSLQADSSRELRTVQDFAIKLVQVKPKLKRIFDLIADDLVVEMPEESLDGSGQLGKEDLYGIFQFAYYANVQGVHVLQDSYSYEAGWVCWEHRSLQERLGLDLWEEGAGSYDIEQKALFHLSTDERGTMLIDHIKILSYSKEKLR